MKIHGILAGAVLAVAMLLTACGGSSTSSSTSSGTASSAGNAAGASGASKAAQALTITAVEGIKYDKSTLDATANQPFTVKLVNNGGMQHNFVIQRTGGTDIAVPGPTKENYLDNGQSKTSDAITLPAGTYKYICSFPGHEGTMNGQLTVK